MLYFTRLSQPREGFSLPCLGLLGARFLWPSAVLPTHPPGTLWGTPPNPEGPHPSPLPQERGPDTPAPAPPRAALCAAPWIPAFAGMTEKQDDGWDWENG